MADCDVCQSEEVAFIVGNSETGEQQFLGPACFARFGLEMARAILPAEEIASALGPMFVQGAERPATAPESAKRKRTRTKAPEAPTGPSGPSSGAPEVDATAQDG